MSDESTTSAPAPAGQPAAPALTQPDLGNEVKELRAQLETAKKKITEETTSRSTLEQRIAELESAGYKSSYEPPPAESQATSASPELQSVMRLAQADPAVAMEQLGRLTEQAVSKAEERAITKARAEINEALKWNNFITDQKKRIKDDGLGDFEEEIAAVARLKMNNRVPREKAVSEAIIEFKAKKDKWATAQPKPDEPLPPGARAEGGTNPPPAPPPSEEREETRSDLVARRLERLAKIRYASPQPKKAGK